MATEDAKCIWMATLAMGHGIAFLSQSDMSFWLNILLFALKDT